MTVKAYNVKTIVPGDKGREWLQFSESAEQAAETAPRNLRCMCAAEGEYVDTITEVFPDSKFEADVWNLAALLQHDAHFSMAKHYGESAESGNWRGWQVAVKRGRKYVNVDIGGSGKYMVDEGGEIYAIKAYGVIHKGHHFGTLATIAGYWWGEYRAFRLDQMPGGVRLCEAPPPSFVFEGKPASVQRETEQRETATGTTAQAIAERSARGRVAIADDVKQVLGLAEVDGCTLRLAAQLNRDLYTRTNAVLVALGGKWSKGQRCHVFAGPVVDVLNEALDRGHAINTKKALNQFYTPPYIAERVASAAQVTSGQSVLEPSAGRGALAIACRHRGASVKAIEVDPANVATLNAIGFVTIEGDFLAMEPSPIFDAVVMNPPFECGADVKHILHALKFVKDGGRVAAICANGPKQGGALKMICETWEDMPAGTFSGEGTNVETALVTFVKRG